MQALGIGHCTRPERTAWPGPPLATCLCGPFPGRHHVSEEAVRTVVRWVETHSNWDESVVIVSSDHGHYLVVDDPQALTEAK